MDVLWNKNQGAAYCDSSHITRFEVTFCSNVVRLDIHCRSRFRLHSLLSHADALFWAREDPPLMNRPIWADILLCNG